MKGSVGTLNLQFLWKDRMVMARRWSPLWVWSSVESWVQDEFEVSTWNEGCSSSRWNDCLREQPLKEKAGGTLNRYSTLKTMQHLWPPVALQPNNLTVLSSFVATLSLATMVPFKERAQDELNCNSSWSKYKVCSLQWNLLELPILKHKWKTKAWEECLWGPVEFRPAEFQVKRVPQKQRPVGRTSSYLMGTMDPMGARQPWCWRTLSQVVMDVSKQSWEKRHRHSMYRAWRRHTGLHAWRISCRACPALATCQTLPLAASYKWMNVRWLHRVCCEIFCVFLLVCNPLIVST